MSPRRDCHGEESIVPKIVRSVGVDYGEQTTGKPVVVRAVRSGRDSVWSARPARWALQRLRTPRVEKITVQGDDSTRGKSARPE